MKLKALFCTILITGLLGAWMLLWVVDEQRGDHSKTSADDETGVVCLTCDSRTQESHEAVNKIIWGRGPVR